MNLIQNSNNDSKYYKEHKANFLMHCLLITYGIAVILSNIDMSEDLLEAGFKPISLYKQMGALIVGYILTRVLTRYLNFTIKMSSYMFKAWIVGIFFSCFLISLMGEMAIIVMLLECLVGFLIIAKYKKSENIKELILQTISTYCLVLIMVTLHVWIFTKYDLIEGGVFSANLLSVILCYVSIVLMVEVCVVCYFNREDIELQGVILKDQVVRESLIFTSFLVIGINYICEVNNEVLLQGIMLAALGCGVLRIIMKLLSRRNN